MRLVSILPLLLLGGCVDRTTAVPDVSGVTVSVPMVDAAESEPPPPTPAIPTIEEWLSAKYGIDPSKDTAMIMADLDDDGRRDWLIHITRPENCGTGGCTLIAARNTGAGWVQIGRMPAARAPIGVMISKTNGYYDLVVGIGGVGGKLQTAKVPFIDGQYGPSTSKYPLIELDFTARD